MSETLREKWEAMSAEDRRAYATPGKRCYEDGCTEPAGTPWGPYWCADHDDERINRISRSMEKLDES